MDEVMTWWEVLKREELGTLQRGMNFRIKPDHSIILMSVRKGAPYQDSVLPDGVTIEYEGHDVPRRRSGPDPKTVDQSEVWPNGSPTQNGLFIKAIQAFVAGKESPETVHVYNKLSDGMWSFQGRFQLLSYRRIKSGPRHVFRFQLRLMEDSEGPKSSRRELPHNRVIPSPVKVEVWRRDEGKCVLCGSNKNLHFDHDIPFSKGGASITAENVKLLCAKHNLQKSDKIE